MTQTLHEYAEWLDNRGLIWPKVPKLEVVKASPYSKPLDGIKAVTWNIYGTLLRVSEGELIFQHPQEIRMQVALEKTIKEFNMWNSMVRKPGAPWKYMLLQFQEVIEELRMQGTKHKGETPEINLAAVWEKLLRRLELKEFEYDQDFYGDFTALGQKVAYFYHRCLQGSEAMPHAGDVMALISKSGIDQALLSDAQAFTLDQTLRALQATTKLPPVGDLLTLNCCALSFQEGIRKPSRSLFVSCVERFQRRGVSPNEILHVGSKMKDDLAIAKQTGMRTALFVGDKLSFQATMDEVRDEQIKPDRLMNDLSQLKRILELPDG
ncbi:MAG: HAD hydrolase-like protein [Planctomycetota bacterium]|nr:HAD hydrolase-like protein [Planctomycetota bacterium]